MYAADNAAQLAQLLRDAGAAHHRAFAAVSGEDAEWPAWYAGFLTPRFTELLGVALSIDRLAADLVMVDREYRDAGSARAWPEYYVEWFVQKYARAAARAAAQCPNPWVSIAVGGHDDGPLPVHP